mgnify:CR=1 FL=1
MWRLAVGNIVGTSIFGLAGFILASLVGLNAVTAAAAIAVSLLPLMLLRSKPYKREFKHDWAKAEECIQKAIEDHEKSFNKPYDMLQEELAYIQDHRARYVSQ